MTDIPAFRRRQLQGFVQQLELPANLDLDWLCLDQALTHKSVDACYNYEQLELLGDAVLRLAATECLQDAFPQASVGELSAVRSVLVSDRALGQLAQDLGFTPYLLVAPSMAVGSTHLADALEAVVAVLYLETHTLKLVRSLLDEPLRRLADQVRQDPARQNYKVALQELTQAHTKTLPHYCTVEQRPANSDSERYQSAVWFGETCWGTGCGPTKKQAEQAAAAAAYDPLAQALTAANDESPPPH